jgi:shikimate dehydrogenase
VQALLGLVGKKLGHSFSQAYFRDKFGKLGLRDVDYQLFELDTLDDLPALLIRNDLVGFNVTVPYKEAIIPFLHDLDPVAKAIGAVNTVVMRDGRTYGANTDVLGFGELLRGMPLTNVHALVMGTGGSSKAVQFYLRLKGVPVTLVSRTKKENALTYEQVDERVIAAHKLLINTTPLGMFPDVNASPTLPYASLTQEQTLIDLVYNPTETLFLQKGKTHGAKTINGLAMLFAQADLSWELYWKNEVMKRLGGS